MPVPFRRSRARAALQQWLSYNYKLTAGLWLPLIMALSGHAQTIGNWNFNNVLSGTGLSFNTVSAASFGPGVPATAFNGGAEWFGENGWPAGGVNTNSYLQFSITPNTGYELNLTNVVLRIRRSNTGSPSGAGPRQWSLRSSLDGFTADIASGSMTHNYNNYTVPLTGFYNQYTMVTFRLYGYSAAVSPGGTSRLVVDNISILGLTTVLPVGFSHVQAQRTDNNNLVQWRADNIQAGTRFNLQRSLNGIEFSTIHSAEAAEGKASQQFGYTDVSWPVGVRQLYYRIQAVEPSGVHHFSPVMRVDVQAAAALSISYVSISHQSLNVCVQAPKNDQYTIAVHTASGILIQKRSFHLQTGAHIITMPLPEIPHGIYIVTVYGNGRLDSKKCMN